MAAKKDTKMVASMVKAKAFDGLYVPILRHQRLGKEYLYAC